MEHKEESDLASKLPRTQFSGAYEQILDGTGASLSSHQTLNNPLAMSWCPAPSETLKGPLHIDVTICSLRTKMKLKFHAHTSCPSNHEQRSAVNYGLSLVFF